MCNCTICHNDFEKTEDNTIRLSENDGFCSSSFNIYVCNNCLDNIFMNSYGFEFVFYNKQLYIKHPINGCYEMAYSKRDVDDAFNPERAQFNKWLESQ